MMGVRCDECRFYALPDMDGARGTCHRYAPQANGVAWPYVAADDWCGEYKSAEPPDYVPPRIEGFDSTEPDEEVRVRDVFRRRR